MDISCITVDCHDPRRLATFWNEALGWGGIAVTSERSGAICGPRSGDTYLEFIVVPEDKSVKNRIHLGCGMASLGELDAEIGRLAGHGVTIAWEEQFPREVASGYRNLVLRDPEGNEFCLGAGEPPQ